VLLVAETAVVSPYAVAAFLLSSTYTFIQNACCQYCCCCYCFYPIIRCKYCCCCHFYYCSLLTPLHLSQLYCCKCLAELHCSSTAQLALALCTQFGNVQYFLLACTAFVLLLVLSPQGSKVHKVVVVAEKQRELRDGQYML
jgi:hypothetical protein